VLKDASTTRSCVPRWSAETVLAGARQAFGASCLPCTSWERWATSSVPTSWKRFRTDEGARRRKKDIYDEDIEALVDQEIAAPMIASAGVADGDRGHPRAANAHHEAQHRRQIRIEEAEGNGRSMLSSTASRRWCRTSQAGALSGPRGHEGTDAQAEVSVRSPMRPLDDRACRRSGYAGGLGQGLSRRPQ